MEDDTGLARSLFTADERDYIRNQFSMYFGTLPSVAEGFYLKIWRSGPRRGEPKLPKAVAGLVARGLMEVRPERLGARAFFTAPGMEELRRLVADSRYVDPKRFGHILAELGVSEGARRKVRVD